jgi:hypothetical protein
MYRIVFVGNHGVNYSSETHHKKTLESMGHEVVALQEGQATGEQILEESMNSDLLVFVHTHGWVTPGASMATVFNALKRIGIPTITFHLDLWLGLKRQTDLETDSFYKTIGHFFTVDKLMADWFNENTEVKGHYIHAGVFDQECILQEKDARLVAHNNDVIFVGSKGYHKEWGYRPTLINWLQDTYRDKFTHVGGDGTGTVRGLMLNHVYANSKVAIGDSLCINFDYPWYWSDRVYETLGRGGFMIHPYIKGMEEDFEDGKHLVFYKFGDFADLQTKIDYYLEHDEEREAIRKAGHEHVKGNHTYKNRWTEILKEIGL